MTQQDEFGGIAPRNLTAEFAPDGAASPRDQNPFAFERLPHFFVIHADVVTAQQVGNIHFTQTIDTDLAAKQFINPRHGARRNIFFAAFVIDKTNDISRRGRNGNDNFVHLLVVEDVGKFVHFSNHRDAINLVILFGRVIVEKTDWGEIELGRSLQFADDQRTRVACADDESAFGF